MKELVIMLCDVIVKLHGDYQGEIATLKKEIERLKQVGVYHDNDQLHKIP